MAGDVMARRIALAFSILTLLLTLPLYTGFDTSTARMQFTEFLPWLPSFGVNYHLGIDGIALPLILLTSFITVLVVIAGWGSIQKRVPQYMGAMLILEGIMIGVFCALDAVLFYVF
ncbi:MAG: NADH-quinone oxidoreductase subunit M, partial [Halofilum sp. (in: g-proteobacteria)]